MKTIVAMILVLVSLNAFATPPQTYDNQIIVQTATDTTFYLGCWTVVDDRNNNGYVGSYCQDSIRDVAQPQPDLSTLPFVDVVVLPVEGPQPFYYNESNHDCKLISVEHQGSGDGLNYRFFCGVDTVFSNGFED